MRLSSIVALVALPSESSLPIICQKSERTGVNVIAKFLELDCSFAIAKVPRKRLGFFLIAAFCRPAKSLSHSEQMRWLVGAVRSEPTTFGSKEECGATRQPKPAYKNQQNQRENGIALGSSRLVLYPVHGQ